MTNNYIKRPKYSVIIITYNQEHLIGRALESILCQKEYLYEIVVSDDCSTDKTWEVIQSYKQQYPAIIKPFRNAVNLGIFGNLESTWDKVSGDIIFSCAGDDVLCNGLFEKANELVEKHNIDYENKAFVLYFDFKILSPDGTETIFSNALVEKFDSISLKLRNLIYNRTSGVSRAVLKQYFPVNKDIGIYADGLVDIQRHIFSDKNYYYPFIGSVYYSGIGISSKTKHNEHLESYIKCLDIYLDIISDLRKSDSKWIQYLKAQLVFELDPNIHSFSPYFNLLIQVLEIKYGAKFLKRELKQFFRLMKLSIFSKQ